MPTVPTLDQIGVPSLGTLPSVQAPSSAFGAQTGRALEQAGSQLGQAVDQIQQRQNLIARSNATNNILGLAQKVTSGDPNNPSDTGYFGTKGQAAIDGRADALKTLNDGVNGIVNGIQDPAVRAQALNDARRTLAYTQEAIGRHFEQQQTQTLVGNADAHLQLGLQNAGIAAGDENGFQAALGEVQSAANNKVAVVGGSPVEAQAAVQAATERAYYQRVQALAARGDVNGAMTVLNANADKFQPGNADQLRNMLAPKMRAQGASSIAGSTLSQADADWTNQQSAGPAIPASKWATQVQSVESGGNPNATNPNSTAAGGAGFIDKTWNSFLSATHPDMLAGKSPSQVAALKTDPDLSQEATIWYARQNAVTLRSSGQPVDATTLRLAHNLGGAGAVQVLSADPSTPLSQVVGAGAVAANPQFATMTAGDLVKQTQARFGRAPVDLSGSTSPTTASAPVQSQADYYRANEQTLVENARQQALKAHPDDPQLADLAASRVQQKISSVINQQAAAYKADNDTVIQAVNGNLSTGVHPRTIEELTSSSPQVSAAWDRLQAQQPEVAHEIATRLLTENAKETTGDAKTYGQGFFGVFSRIHAPDGDPDRITDARQLYTLVGQPGGLTMAGLAKAREELAAKGTPDGEAETHMRSEFFKDMHGQITGTDDGLGIKDPKGEDIYLRAMAASYKQIDKLKAEGKTPAQIYSPDSPDYVGKIIPAFKRSPAQISADMIGANDTQVAANTPPAQPGFISRTLGLAPSTPEAPDLTTPTGIRRAYASGQITRQTAVAALVGKPFQPEVPR